MRLEKVVAYSFGPFRDQTLELAPAMNIIFGPNEAGKSSWHAALFAGLCGLRRGRGRKSEVVAFADRHRPWDGEDWEAGVVVELADGRRIELRHDLAGLVACRAEDLTWGGDVSDQIINEGTPDGSRWLGLDRRSFLATACVRQAELFEVTVDPECLQEHLQRAAATGGTDRTAAAAISAIDDFFDRNVGSERTNSTKPLRRAMARVQQASTALEDARWEHGSYLELVAEAEALEREAAEAERDLRLVEAAAARAQAERRRARLDAARAIATELPERPPAPLEEDELANDVATALEAWEGVAQEPVLVGPTVESLEAELATVPAMPEGDVEPHAEVVAAHDAVRLASAERTRHEAAAPPQGAEPQPAGVTPGAAMVAGIACALLGVVLVALGAVLPGVAALVAALGASAVARRDLISRGQTGESVRGGRDRWTERLEALDRELAAARERLADALTTRGVAPGPDPVEATERYEQACRERLRLSAQAQRRAELERQIATQKQAEKIVTAARSRRAVTLERVREVAHRCGLSSTDEASLIAELRRWQQERNEARNERAHQYARYVELQKLLGGKTFEDLEADARRLDEIAFRTGAGLDPEAVAGLELEPDVLAQRDALRERAEKAARAAHECRGRVDEKGRSLPVVAEAEEVFEAAEAELARLRALERTLKATRGFLEQAQKQVHLSVAPRLQASVERWLPELTGGRYVDASVNPQTLHVRVRDSKGRWRDAMLLSHGTAEQIYLLLRVALAEHLTAADEVAPLILDEVTVQSDPARTIAILEMLHALSKDRQIVLFTQEPEVLRWAQGKLSSRVDTVVSLEALPAA